MLKIYSLIMACTLALALAACDAGSTPTPDSTPPIVTLPPVPTLGPPATTSMPKLSGRLWADQALGNIWVIDVASGAVSRADTGTNVYPTQPWSDTEAKTLVWAGSEKNSEGIASNQFSLYANGKTIMQAKDGLAYTDPALSADGKVLYFTRIGLGDEPVMTRTIPLAVQMIALDASSAKPSTIVTAAMLPAPSADNQWLTYVRITNALSATKSIRIRNLQTGEDTLAVAPDRFFDVYGPHWMPDGKSIIFSAALQPQAQSNPTERNALLGVIDAVLPLQAANAHSWSGDVWRVNVDGTGLTQLTHAQLQAPIAAPAPDGKHIAIISNDGIYVMDADGRNFDQVSQDGGNGGIVWTK